MNKPRKIILVEDNPADVQLAMLALQNLPAHYDILHFGNGKLLLNYLKRARFREISLILLDLNMPKMGGIDVLRAINNKARYRKLPFVVFTTSEMERDIAACYQLGACAFVRKPHDFGQYEKTIRAIVKFYCKVNLNAKIGELKG